MRHRVNWVAALLIAVAGTGCGGSGGGADPGPEVAETAIDVPGDRDAPSGSDEDSEPVPEEVSEVVDTLPEEVVPAWPDLVLNEIQCHSPDFVEVFNRGATDADPAGWTLREKDGAAYVLPALPAVAPGGFLLLERQTSKHDGFTFGIRCAADTLEWVRPDGVVVDEVAPPEVVRTWGRLPDGQGAWVETVPTPGTANGAVANGAGQLFDPTRLAVLDLGLTDEARASLDAQPETLVDATLSVKLADQTVGPLEIGVRLKGSSSFLPISDKASFKLKLDFKVAGQALFGLERLTLNSMVIDPSMVVEALSYELFRAFGVPAPRTGYAWLRLNGEDYGLFLMLETYDEVWAADRFDSTQHVYEFGGDLYPDSEEWFEVQAGSDGDREDLRALIEAAQASDDTWFEAISARTDLVEMIHMWAVELYINHWDGYAPAVNNWFLHSTDDGRFSMLPWGTDQTFGFWWGVPGELYDLHRQGSGILFQRCLRDTQCGRLYDEALLSLLDEVDELDLEARLDQIQALIRPFVKEDTRSHYTPETQALAVEQVRDFLHARRGQAGEQLACVLAGVPDADGDGALCTVDCRDDDPAIHPGEPEICGDGIDQDCSGQADDGKDCDCQVVMRGVQRYHFCPSGRTYDEAVAHCGAQGAAVVTIHDPSEAAWLRDMGQQKGGDFWLGLTDRALEGTFVWADGTALDYANWSDNEPNGMTEAEDCVVKTWDGRWMDVDCSAYYGVACEEPCPGPIDADGDGYDACLGDCDDGNPEVRPGAVDVCSDGIDQDCDGLADNGTDCPACLTILRGTHRYYYCPGPFSWADARATCLSYGTDLAVLGSEKEVQYLSARLNQHGLWGEYWIGLSDGQEEGAFYWVDGTYVGTAFWNGDQPDDGWGDLSEDCVTGTPWGGWNDADCELPLPALCEDVCAGVDPSTGLGVDADGDGFDLCTDDCDDLDPAVHPGAIDVCADGLDQDCTGQADDPGWCQWECFPAKELELPIVLCQVKRTWKEARDACAAWSGDLAWFESAEQQATVLATVGGMGPGGQPDLWIGANDLDVEGTFLWADGSTPTFIPWAEGQPNDGGVGQDCVRVSPDGTWNDTDCQARYHPLCRRFQSPSAE